MQLPVALLVLSVKAASALIFIDPGHIVFVDSGVAFTMKYEPYIPAQWQ